MLPFTRRKFLRFDLAQQHKKCAEVLRGHYEAMRLGREESWELYETIVSWMKLQGMDRDLKAIADRYHWHLEQAGRSLKEHNLLPSLRTGDRVAKCDYLPVAIYLDRLRSAYNVGSILRTCEALRVGSVYFSPATPFIDNEKVERTAMGAAPLVPCFRDVPLSALPRPIIVLDTCEEAIPLSQYIFPERFTLVLGNEEVGVSDEALKLADVVLEIPMLGAKNSLNVACAFAIAAAHIRFDSIYTNSL